jgi:hypothetical protein
MFKIAIPSYKRSDIIAEKTLATLERGGVLNEDIHIFVVAEEEELYKKACPHYNIVVGVLGLVAQRNFIHSYFPENTPILMIDDDIKEMYYAVDDKTKHQITNIPFLLGRMLFRMKMEKVSICGVYPVDNPKFASANKEVTTDFRFLIGCCYLVRNTPDSIAKDDEGTIEDKIRTIKYFEKEKKTLRFNWLCVKTTFCAKGGLSSATRKQEHANEAKRLVLKYPQYLRLQESKGKFSTDAKFKKQKKLTATAAI